MDFCLVRRTFVELLVPAAPLPDTGEGGGEGVVEETLYVLDINAAFAAAGKVRKEAYGTARPQCASTLVGVTTLSFPEQLVEISFKAMLSGVEAKPR